MSHADWFQSISTVLTIILILIKLAETTKDLILWDIQEGTLLTTFDKYKREFQVFGLLEAWRGIVEGMILVSCENYPLVVIASFISISLGSLILLIKYKPCKDNNLMIYNESGLQLLQIICLIWASDDRYNFLMEDDRILMGWIAVGIAGVLLTPSLVLSFVNVYKMIKSFVRKRRFIRSR
jgi:hypothetical protein